MMKHEFEVLAGYEVTYEDYSKIIEPMYMAIPESISKQEFVKMIDRKRFDFQAKEKAEKKAMLKAMKEIAEERAQNCEHFCDYEAEEKLMEIARSYMSKFFPKNLGYHGDIERKLVDSIHHAAWGYVEYPRRLTAHEVYVYELTEAELYD